MEAEVWELKKNCNEKNYPGKHTIVLVDDDLIDNHHGSIRLISGEGKGTIVTIYLPALRSEEKDVEKEVSFGYIF
jgi:signal transduction histidine kinase